jgi:hypothetical protein
MKRLFYLMLVVFMFNTESAKPASYIYSGAERLYRAIYAYWFSKQIKAATTQEIATSTDDLSSKDDEISNKELAAIELAKKLSLNDLEAIAAKQAELLDAMISEAQALRSSHTVHQEATT